MDEDPTEKIPYDVNCVYSAREVARILGRHVNFVKALCASGRLAAARTGGGYLVGGFAIMDFLRGEMCGKPVVK